MLLSVIIWLYRDKGTIHGLDHVLRVWLHTNVLLDVIKPSLSLKQKNALLYAALLHDSGRKNDFSDSKHGKQSRKIVSILGNDWLDKTDIKALGILCEYHNKSDEQCRLNVSKNFLYKSLLILKDADALDRERLNFPMIGRLFNGRLDYSKLRHEASVKLAPYASEFFHLWNNARQKVQKVQSGSFVISRLEWLGFLLEDLSVNLRRKYLSKKIHFYELYNTYVNALLKHVRVELDLMKKLHGQLNEASIFLHKVQNYAKAYRLDKLVSLLDSTKTDILKFIKSDVQKILYPFVCDYSNLYDTNLRNKLIEFIKQPSQKCEGSDLLLVYALSVGKVNVLENIFSQSMADKVSSLVRASYYDLLLKKYVAELISRGLIKLSLHELSKYVDTTSNIDFLWVAKTIVRIADKVWVLDHITTKNLLKLSIKIIKRAYRHDEEYLKDISKTLVQLFSRDFLYWSTQETFYGGAMPRCMNMFHMYGFLDLKDIRVIIKLQYKLLLLIRKTGIIVDKAVELYFLPLCMAKVGYKCKSLKKLVADKSKLVKVSEAVKYSSKYQYPWGTFKYYIGIEQDNYWQVLSYLRSTNKDIYIQKTMQELSNDKWRVCINLPSFDVLKKIIKSKRILSLFNTSSTFMGNWAKKLLGDRIDYFLQTEYRDVLLREMLLRTSNVSNMHPVHGYLTRLDAFNTTSKSFVGKILDIAYILRSPTRLFMRRYGNIVLALNKEVINRTLFTLFDSSMDFRKYPVGFEYAKRLWILVNNFTPDVLKRKLYPNMFVNYVEAIILGGVTVQDIEQIIVPRKLINKSKEIVDAYDLRVNVVSL